MSGYEFVDLDEDGGILGFGDLLDDEDDTGIVSAQSKDASKPPTEPRQNKPLSQKAAEALELVREAEASVYSWGADARENCARQLYELDYAAERVQLPCLEHRRFDAHRRTTEPAYARDFRATFPDLERWLLQMRTVSQGGWHVAAITDGIKNPAIVSLLPKASPPSPAAQRPRRTVRRAATSAVIAPNSPLAVPKRHSSVGEDKPKSAEKSKKKKQRAPSRHLSLSDLEHKEKALGNAGLFERLAKDKTLIKQPWYHGDISRGEAVQRLASTNPGTFLLRLSSRRKGITLSLNTPDGPKHFIIIPAKGNFSIFGRDGNFKTIPKLVDFYRKNPLAVDGTSLVFPCPLPEDETDEGHAYVEFLRSDVDKQVMRAVAERGRARREQHEEERRRRQERRQLTPDSSGSGSARAPRQAQRRKSNIAQLVGAWEAGKDSSASRENLLTTDDDDDDDDDDAFEGSDAETQSRLTKSADAALWRNSMFGARTRSSGSLAASLLSITPAERINPAASEEEIREQIEELTDHIAAEEHRITTVAGKTASTETAQASQNLERLRSTLRQYEDHLHEMQRAHPNVRSTA
ncbi:hypothetical protein PTSG_11613 [Salpingoeca rosetta]|uniref:SH2 domain-containing protein n=1 Tax=Salpingoeca rosetta (strain ATCC 50818 / BSB-021) TaxID=946362 RepID=F2TWW4_SALR5|nr:uncharacterized protein PTSG_11613 [Salpingoeca rosetta]EGD72560.1 hypothetical protein PTSG_11613 [Salpingoeca rosetta]|eukprot:XP_004999129.1 hypothetical protein PTSG_11613 [Salpingoeca rosetta]